jgi:Delta3-Delta2-enoyl-CoA isomerase
MSTEVEAPLATERRGDVTVLRMVAGENRFNPTMLDAIEASLAELEEGEGPRALVLTGEGKFFSNGLDLDWMGTAPPGGAEEVVARVHSLLGRVLAFPAATVAAINGHCFAAGAMLAAAFDSRVMRVDRGFWCLPEVDIGIPFTPAMTALLKARLPTTVAHEAMTTGRRYGGDQALAAGLVDDAVAEELVLEAAVERAAELAGKAGDTMGAIKRNLYADTLAAIEASRSSLH